MAKRANNSKARKRGRPPIESITDSQRRTLTVIQEFMAQQGFPPTMQELADELGMTTSGAYDQVNQLIRKGYLKRQSRRARGLTLVRQAEEMSIADLMAVPLVGHVAAGLPILAEENVIGEVHVPGNVARSGNCFALKVAGDSMTGAGILDGDVVIVRQQQLAQSGDIVVALIDGDATVKRLYWAEDTIELRAENRKYRPIAIDPETDFRVLGKVVAHSHARS